MVWLCLGYVAVTSPHINMIIGCVVRVNSQRRWAAQTLRSRRQILRRERARRVRPAAARILRRARDPPLAEALLRSCGPGLRLVDHLDHGGDVVYRHACKLGSEALTIEMSAHLCWVGIPPPVTTANSLSASTPFSSLA